MKPLDLFLIEKPTQEAILISTNQNIQKLWHVTLSHKYKVSFVFF